MLIPSNQSTMTSREIAELTGKRHSDVMEAIRKMEDAWVKIGQRNFSLMFAITQLPNGGQRNDPYYELSKTECLYVATKFNDEARAKLVLRWEKLEIQHRESSRILSPAEALLKQIELMVAQEKEISALKERTENIENKVNGLLQIQASTEAELKALPVSTEELPEMGLRDKIRLMVNRYCQACNIMQHAAWDHVYQQLYYRYHVPIKSYSKVRKDESWLDVAQRKGHVDKIYIIVSNMLRDKNLSNIDLSPVTKHNNY